MITIPATSCVDGYKLSHIEQYVKGTQQVGANLTLRNNTYATKMVDLDEGKAVHFGISYAVQTMRDNWQRTFFNLPKAEAIKRFKRRIKNYLGTANGDTQIKAMSKLHDLGYLPLRIKTLPEGSRINMGIPTFTVTNTHKDFYWLTNYMETYLSQTYWPMVNSASVGYLYQQISKEAGAKTGADPLWYGIANHCFASRGHRGLEDATISGMGHSLCNYGTDTVSAIDALEQYYGADSDKELIACSVNAFEHATATQRIAYYRASMSETEAHLAERASVRDICENLYPRGIVSYVADSEDYFRFIKEDLKALKDVIQARTADADGLPGKFVVRPDSSPKTPLEIICGDFEFTFNNLEEAESELNDVHYDQANEDCEGAGNMGNDYYETTFECQGKFYTARTPFGYNRHDKTYYYTCSDCFYGKGAHGETEIREIEPTDEMQGTLNILWETFGGIVNPEGYKVLDPSIGIIYGEAISPEMARNIYARMEKMGFCASNILFGVGSWGYIGNSSRDSYGIAIKGTNSIVKGKEVPMQKDPKTSSFSKKSAKGLLRVEFEEDNFVLYDEQTPEQETQGLLKEIFVDGELVNAPTLTEIRERLA